MTFWAGASVSTGAASAVAPSVVDFGGAGSAFFGGGAAGVSIEARMREIGGRVVFFFTSPSTPFFSGCFLSINETLAAGARGVVAGFGCAFATGAGCAAAFAGA